jgi:biopolymer transport protein ExbB/TolQ
MRLAYKLLSISAVSTMSMLVFNSNYNVALAQIRGQDSQQFFDRGNQLMEQQIQQIQQENTQQIQQTPQENRQQTQQTSQENTQQIQPENTQQIEENDEVKETELENQLEMKLPDKLEEKEVPAPAMGLDENVPESPDEEIKIQQN